jgi:hypothetical protein
VSASRSASIGLAKAAARTHAFAALNGAHLQPFAHFLPQITKEEDRNLRVSRWKAHLARRKHAGTH